MPYWAGSVPVDQSLDHIQNRESWSSPLYTEMVAGTGGKADESIAPLGSYVPGRGVGEGVESRYLLASSVDGGRRDG